MFDVQVDDVFDLPYVVVAVCMFWQPLHSNGNAGPQHTVIIQMSISPPSCTNAIFKCIPHAASYLQKHTLTSRRTREPRIHAYIEY